MHPASKKYEVGFLLGLLVIAQDFFLLNKDCEVTIFAHNDEAFFQRMQVCNGTNLGKVRSINQSLNYFVADERYDENISLIIAYGHLEVIKPAVISQISRERESLYSFS